MGLLNQIEQERGGTRAPKHGYGAAEISRLTDSLARQTEYINKTLRYQLRLLRARSRQATQNNPYARRFASAVVRNICGPCPFKLQAKLKFGNGNPDERANGLIEDAWELSGRKGTWDITGKWNRPALDRLIARTWAVDGEVILRKLRGPEYGPYAFQVQLLDTDRLDETRNLVLQSGNVVHMGVELNAVGRPVAYHLRRQLPRDFQIGILSGAQDFEVVPADEIVHLFVPDFAEQVRGVPWIYAALLNLVHLGYFEEAAVIAARVGATQMGFITTESGEPPPLGQGQTEQKEPVITAEPATFPVLPKGASIVPWNPKYPDAAVGPFTASILRGVAVGIDMAHHNLSGNMEGVNYSSARIDELQERDAWMVLQDHMIGHLHEPLIADWIKWAIASGRLPLNPARIPDYLAVRFQGRRWQWVDPLKEMQANVLAKDNQLTSRTRILAATGEDYEDTIEEIAAENALAALKGVELESTGAAKPNAAPTPQDGGDANTTGDAANA